MMDLNELQKHIDQVMNEQNNRAIPEFEGYSPSEMYQILYDTFGEDSPIKLQKLSDADYKRIPLLNQIKYLTDVIDQNGEIKLTKKGYLPPKIVIDLYQQGFIKEWHIEEGISKLSRESDSMSINLTGILLELSGLTKKKNGKLSLTKKAKNILQDDFALLQLIIVTFATKFNWAYYDRFGENQIGQLGYGFTLILLAKYGHGKRLDSFYAEKYFQAFPDLLDSVEPTIRSAKEIAMQCYSTRTFDRFLDYFGLIKIEQEGDIIDKNKYIAKTDLFDKFIKCMPHQSRKS